MSCNWPRHFLRCTFEDHCRQMNHHRSWRSLGRVCPRSVWRSTGTRHESWHGYSTTKTWKRVVSRGSELFTWLLALATKHTTRTNKSATFDSAIVCHWFKYNKKVSLCNLLHWNHYSGVSLELARGMTVTGGLIVDPDLPRLLYKRTRFLLLAFIWLLRKMASLDWFVSIVLIRSEDVVYFVIATHFPANEKP